MIFFVNFYFFLFLFLGSLAGVVSFGVILILALYLNRHFQNVNNLKAGQIALEKRVKALEDKK